MSTWKIVVRIAAFAGALALIGVRAEASGCCAKDCDDAYGTMLNSGVPARDAAEWYRGCLRACEEHGDPTTCPLMEAMASENGSEADLAPEADACELDPTGAPAVPPDPILIPEVLGQHALLPIPLQ